MKFRSVLSLLACAATFATPASAESTRTDALVVVGAPGDEDFAEGFRAAARKIETSCSDAGVAISTAGTAPPGPGIEDRDVIRHWIRNIDPHGPHPVWIVYLGHGTWDGQDARLNIHGADVTAHEIRDWLQDVDRPVVFVHGGSAASPFIPALSGANRVIVSATESGDEQNYARFGEYFAEAISGNSADFDEDGQVSALEAFIAANHQVETFYSESARMRTEHALIDDNGDSRGTPADWFRGNKAERSPSENFEPDGDLAKKIALIETPFERSLTAEQRQLRETVESEIETLKSRKHELPESDYLDQLEVLLRKMAPLYAPSEDT